jgi:cytochrome c biogenesis protein CcdA
MLIAIFVWAAASAPVSASSDAEVSERLHFIESHLEAGAPMAQLWFGGWTAVYSGLTVGQAILFATTHNRENQINYVVGGIGALVGVLSMVVIPMPAAFAACHLRGLPETTPEERVRKLEVAERWLNRAADGEAFGQSWLVQAGGFVFTIAEGLVLALGYHYLGDGARTTFIGIAVAQTQVTTQPMRATTDRDAYLRQFGLGAPPAPGLHFHFAAFPGGAAVAGDW